jgi:hypothetical protein
MKKINQYLPFILWTLSTIILTILALLALPLFLLVEQFRHRDRKDLEMRQESDPAHFNTYAICNSHT